MENKGYYLFFRDCCRSTTESTQCALNLTDSRNTNEQGECNLTFFSNGQQLKYQIKPQRVCLILAARTNREHQTEYLFQATTSLASRRGSAHLILETRMNMEYHMLVNHTDINLSHGQGPKIDVTSPYHI